MKQAERYLDQQTGLYNKEETQRLINEYLALDKPGTHVLFVIDVDNYREINQIFGRTVGNTLIKDMAHKIKASFRNSDIVGRIGGDEFVVFMKATTEEYARQKAELLCKNAQKVVYGGEKRLKVTVSVGGAIYGKDGTDYEELFNSADEAMYSVKIEGRDGFQFRSGEQENAETSNRAKPNAIVTNGENVDRELLNLVSVFVYDMQKPQMTMTNSWTNLGKIYDRDIIPRSWKFFENEPVGVFVELKSVLENEQIDEETKRAFDRSL